jgi:hypothetical protein
MVLSELENTTSMVLNDANKLCNDLVGEEIKETKDHKDPLSKQTKPLRVRT